MKVHVLNSVFFCVGTCAIENWTMLAKADKNYTWVHLDGYPSAHVIIEIEDPTSEDLEFARQLILQQTKKAPAHAAILYSQVKNVKRGANPGEVVVKSESYFPKAR